MQSDGHLSNIKSLVSECIKQGITNVVVSPGSRNAPLTILFSSTKSVDLHVVVDERSAGFYAMGLAQQLQRPVAILCTSGTASLNYAPAVAEAYYLQVPLLILTADRPLKWLHHSEGQQINQSGIYDNFSTASFTYDTALKLNDLFDIFPNAVDALRTSSRPVHINIPIEEPFYQLEPYYPIDTPKGHWENKLTSEALAFTNKEKSLLSKNILVAIGCKPPDQGLQTEIEKLSQLPNVVVLSETTANLKGKNMIQNPDLLLPSLSEASKQNLKPDLLITSGTHFISKHLKNFLRNYKPSAHWHIDSHAYFPDTFKALTKQIKETDEKALNTILQLIKSVQSDYSNIWHSAYHTIRSKMKMHSDKLPWCEFSAFKSVYKSLPKGSVLHLGNSMSVRYAQYLESRDDIIYFSNRGTSGIDGSLSTAVGAAMASGKQHTIILGDLSFLYDSNALWKEKLPNNLKVIVLNNGGGGIFRFINGPSNFDKFEKTFLAGHNMNFEHIAKQFKLPYQLVQNENELKNILNGFYHKASIEVLEIKTGEEENNKILKTYIHKIIK